MPGTSARGCLLFVGFFHRPTTLGANSNNPQQVLGHLEAVLCRHRVLDRLQLSRKELDDPATLRADHMIVMLVLVVMFVVGNAVTETNFARESGFGQQLQRSVDRGLPDAGVFPFDEPVEILTGKMLFRPQEDIKNQVALSGALEPFLLDMFKKDFLFFSHCLDESGCDSDLFLWSDSTLRSDHCEDSAAGADLVRKLKTVFLAELCVQRGELSGFVLSLPPSSQRIIRPAKRTARVLTQRLS